MVKVLSLNGIGTLRLLRVILVNCFFIHPLMAQLASHVFSQKVLSDTQLSVSILHELSGSHLLFSMALNPPFMTVKRLDDNKTIIYNGNVADVADYIAEALNITYTFIPITEDEEKKYGSLQATINLLKKNEVDVVARPMSLLSCSKEMDCSIPLHYQKFQLMVPLPEKETQIVAPIRPFQYEVWIGLFIAIIFVSLALIFLKKYNYNRKHKIDIPKGPFRTSIWKTMLYLVTGEGDWTGYNQLSFRLVQGAWCLAAFVLFNAYCSTLISYLISPRLMPMAKSYDDLASGKPQKLKLATEKNEIMATLFLKATTDPLKGLGNLLRKYPESQFTDRMKGFDLMFTGQYAYAGVEQRIAVFMQKAFEKSGYCRFTISNATLDRMSALAWGFPKNWRYTNAVNHRIQWLAQWGLPDYWVKRVTPQTEQCNEDKRKASSNGKEQRKILSLNDLSGPFMLLMIGYMLSLLVFLVENIYNNFKNRENR